MLILHYLFEANINLCIKQKNSNGHFLHVFYAQNHVFNIFIDQISVKRRIQKSDTRDYSYRFLFVALV